MIDLGFGGADLVELTYNEYGCGGYAP